MFRLVGGGMEKKDKKMGGYLVENVLRLMGGSLEKIDKNGRILS